VAETRKFPHHLIREIFEQPDALRRTIEPRVSLAEGRVRLDEVRISREELRALRRINIVASGTSRHAGMTGQYMMQELAGLPVDVDYASEFEYRNPMIGQGELSIFITQSGETADTTAAQREARRKGSRTIAISNVEGSTIAREADGFIYTHAGPEISIASTKAFTAQMACLFLFALYLGEIKEKVSPELAGATSANCSRFRRRPMRFSPRPIKSKSSPSFTIAWTISCFSGAPFITRSPWMERSS
jgi:glutamine---fructose-6-phosphate transaminase (isomerizing)